MKCATFFAKTFLPDVLSYAVGVFFAVFQRVYTICRLPSMVFIVPGRC